jgi:uncharacterized protein YutD
MVIFINPESDLWLNEGKMLIKTFFKEQNDKARAEIWHDADRVYHIDYFDYGGNKFKTEHFPNNSIHFVENAAENWVRGLRILQG